jgi:hypothetical protein
LFFYLLAPFYQLAGHRAIGLTAGALAINLSSVLAVGLLVLRNSGRVAATAAVVALVVFLWRADGVFGSIWSAHIVILPLAALLVSCAALAADDFAALPVTVLVASFVVQTDIALLAMFRGHSGVGHSRHGCSPQADTDPYRPLASRRDCRWPPGVVPAASGTDR